MKTITKWASLLAILLAVACAGAAARTNVQLPAIQATWANLREAVVRHVAVERDDQTDAAMVAADAAVASGDPVQLIAVDWARLDRAVEIDLSRQLAAGQIGPLGAESRRALLIEFAESRAIYARTKP